MQSSGFQTDCYEKPVFYRADIACWLSGLFSGTSGPGAVGRCIKTTSRSQRAEDPRGDSRWLDQQATTKARMSESQQVIESKAGDLRRRLARSGQPLIWDQQIGSAKNGRRGNGKIRQ